MNGIPSGTITFLFTDIEGSTKLAQQYPEAMPAPICISLACLQASPAGTQAVKGL